MKTVKLQFGSDESITITEPKFDTSYDAGGGIVKYKKDYKFMFSGNPKLSDGYEGSDITSNDTSKVFNSGDKIALIENFDWNQNLSEFAGEITFNKNIPTEYDDYGSVDILLDNFLISFSGEYSQLEQNEVDIINNTFNTHYKIIFIGN